MKYLVLILVILILPYSIISQAQMELEMRGELPPWQDKYSQAEVETAVFAGGCFWGVEGVFEQLKGVLDVQSGYAGGSAASANYQMVSGGATGHAESVEIIYDPELISYETLLDVFFTVAHNPTELNFQGPDYGTQYRSAIFYLNGTQRNLAIDKIESLEEQEIYDDPIVTEVKLLETFYPAEKYHQDFMRLNPTHRYIVYWDIPKLQELFRKFPELIAE